MMATREGGWGPRRTRKARTWRAGGGGRTTPGACYFGPEARHARRRQAPWARRRPRVMMPRPPQSKHASSLPLFAPLLDRSRAASSFCPAKRLSVSISLRGRERARLRQRNGTKPEIERSDEEYVRTSLKKILSTIKIIIKDDGKSTLSLICCEIILMQSQCDVRVMGELDTHNRITIELSNKDIKCSKERLFSYRYFYQTASGSRKEWCKNEKLFIKG